MCCFRLTYYNSTVESGANKLPKLRKRASRVHFTKIHFGKIHTPPRSIYAFSVFTCFYLFSSVSICFIFFFLFLSVLSVSNCFYLFFFKIYFTLHISSVSPSIKQSSTGKFFLFQINIVTLIVGDGGSSNTGRRLGHEVVWWGDWARHSLQ